MPHLIQLMVSPVRPSVPKGEPPVLDLYLSPSLEILVLSSRAMVSLMISIKGWNESQYYKFLQTL